MSTIHLSVPDVSGLTVCDAAHKYANAGWYVLPVAAGIKHAGSVLGTGWPEKTSQDATQIDRWFRNRDLGLALHVGRSGALAFDVDQPGLLPAMLATVLAECRPAFQSTRPEEPGRGHYLFAQPAAGDLGNGKGSLRGSWGDVRGKNGIIMVEPTVHEKHPAARYRWLRRGALQQMPPELLAALRAPARIGPAAPRIGSQAEEAPPSRRRSGPFARQALERVAVATERNNALYEASCRLGELVRLGRMSEGAAVMRLAEAGRARGLTDIEMLGADGKSGTIYSGLRTTSKTLGQRS